jgi:hypothetical protein
MSYDFASEAGVSLGGIVGNGTTATTMDSLGIKVGSNTERVTILSNGNVGIGISPSFKLDVDGSLRLSTGNIIRPDGTGVVAGFGNTTSSINADTFNINNASGVTNHLFKDSSGKFGLGTTSILAENIHISTGNFGCDASDINNSHDNIIIEDSDGGGITFLVNNTTGGAGIVVNSETSNLAGVSVTNAILGYMDTKHWAIYTGGVNNIRFNATHTLPIGLGGSVSSKAIEVSGDQQVVEITMYNASSGNTASIGQFGNAPGVNKTAGAGFLADYGEVPALQWRNQQIILQNGSAGTPSLTFQNEAVSDSGIYSSGDGNINFSTDGTRKLTLNSSGQLRIDNNGSASVPAIFFNSDSTSGIYADTANGNDISISDSGFQIARFDSIAGIVMSRGMQVGGQNLIKAVACGRVDGASGISTPFGSITASRTGVGEYTITHNFGTNNYIANLTVLTPNPAFVYIVNITAINNNTMSYRVKSSTDIPVDATVNFTLMGTTG